MDNAGATVRCLLAHGFEGSPQGRKARIFKDDFGFEVVAPKLSDGGWTPEGQSDVLEAAYTACGDIDLIIASSFGALAALYFARRHARAPLRLLLLAPAIGLDQVWGERLGAEALAEWQMRGHLSHFHQGLGEHVELPYSHFTQSQAIQGIPTVHPTVIIHGMQDEVIPIENVWAYARRSPGVALFMGVKDNHRLSKSASMMRQGAQHLLSLG